MNFKGALLENPVAGVSIRFLTTAQESGGAKLEVETTFRKSKMPTWLHQHPQQHEHLAVEQGELCVRLGNIVRVLRAGEQLQVAPNQPHAVWNEADQPAVVRRTKTPALRSEELLTTVCRLAQAGLLAADGSLSVLQSAVLLHEFRQERQLAYPAPWLQGLLWGALRPMALLAGLPNVPVPQSTASKPGSTA